MKPYEYINEDGLIAIDKTHPDYINSIDYYEDMERYGEGGEDNYYSPFFN